MLKKLKQWKKTRGWLDVNCMFDNDPIICQTAFWALLQHLNKSDTTKLVGFSAKLSGCIRSKGFAEKAPAPEPEEVPPAPAPELNEAPTRLPRALEAERSHGKLDISCLLTVCCTNMILYWYVLYVALPDFGSLWYTLMLWKNLGHFRWRQCQSYCKGWCSFFCWMMWQQSVLRQGSGRGEPQRLYAAAAHQSHWESSGETSTAHRRDVNPKSLKVLGNCGDQPILEFHWIQSVEMDGHGVLAAFSARSSMHFFKAGVNGTVYPSWNWTPNSSSWWCWWSRAILLWSTLRRTYHQKYHEISWNIQKLIELVLNYQCHYLIYSNITLISSTVTIHHLHCCWCLRYAQDFWPRLCAELGSLALGEWRHHIWFETRRTLRSQRSRSERAPAGIDWSLWIVVSTSTCQRGRPTNKLPREYKVSWLSNIF